MKVLTRRTILKAATITPVVAATKNHSPIVAKPLKPPITTTEQEGGSMSAPQLITIPALAGVNGNNVYQIPIVDGTDVTLQSFSNTLTLSLCNDSNFSSPFPLGPLGVLPLPGTSTIFVQNPNTNSVNILVLNGIVPVSAPINYGGLLTAHGTPGGGILLPAPPLGYIYVLKQITYDLGAASATELNIRIYNGSRAYFEFDGVGTNFGNTVSLNNQMISFLLAYTMVIGTSGSFDVTYDLVPI